jgi:hypothetical protein
MDELISLVVKKSGLKKDQAKVVVELVLDYLKKKLPKAVGAQIDLFLKGGGKLAGVAGMAEGLLGGAAPKKGGKK